MSLSATWQEASISPPHLKALLVLCSTADCGVALAHLQRCSDDSGEVVGPEEQLPAKLLCPLLLPIRRTP